MVGTLQRSNGGKTFAPGSEGRMTCKIDHTLDDAIPKALCRTCTPRAVASPVPPTQPADTSSIAVQQERFDKRQKRKLKAEAKRLQTEINKINGRNPQATAKIQAALDLVNRDLYLVS
jgi:hypothetical protein